VDLNHVIDILHLLGNEIHDWRFVCCRWQWRSVLGKRRRNAAISNEKELVNLISWFSTNIKSIFTAVVRIIVNRSLSTGVAWPARFRI
jgi:hypothetical protein